MCDWNIRLRSIFVGDDLNSTLWDYRHEKRDGFAILGNMRLRLQSRAFMVEMGILQEDWLAGIWHCTTAGTNADGNFSTKQAQKFISAYSAFLKRQGKLPIPG